jgi:hypothetical protein
MLNVIAKLESLINEDSRKLKSIKSSLSEIQSLIKKNDYISAHRISKDKLRSIIAKHYPNSIALLDEIDVKMEHQIRKFKIDFDKELISSCKESGLTPISGDSRKGYKIKGIIEATVDFDKGKSTVGTYRKRNKINSVKQQDIIRIGDALKFLSLSFHWKSHERIKSEFVFC